jgi:adenylate cyclase
MAKRRTRMLIVVAVLAAGAGIAAYATHLLRRSELQTIDARFSIRGNRKPPQNIVFVGIDNATLDELAHTGHRFPYPRRFDAQVIDRLRQAGARTIAIDLEFTERTDERDDLALVEAIERARGKIVLAADQVERGGQARVLFGATPSILREIGARAGDVRLRPEVEVDSDGVTRKIGYAYNDLRSFPVVTAEVTRGRPIPSSEFEDGTLPIDYVGPPETFKSISYSKVLNGQFNPQAVKGKTVIVGVSAPILGDIHATPTTNGGQMPGAEIWANGVDTLLSGAPLRFAPGWLDIVLICLLGAIVPLGSLRLRGWRSLLDALALALVFTIAAQLAFNNGLILSFVYPLLALALGTLGTLAVLYMNEALERQRVRDVFSRFVPADVVDEVLASANENLRLGGVERDCTVLFSDLRGFTSFSESQPAAQVIEVVNHYLNEMTEAILAEGGTLIAYMGDGIMAAFGAPLEQSDHADRALRAAREMVGPRLERFNAWIAEQGFGHRFVMGVGLNSGPVMAGNVGSEERVEYTAIGDTTNTASRLEGMTKDSGTMLFVSESTRERMREEGADLVWVGEFDVRGRAAKLRVWTLESARSDASGDARPASADREGEGRSGDILTTDEADGGTEPGAAEQPAG